MPSQHLLVLLFGTFWVISDSAETFGTRMSSDAIGISVAPSLFHTCIHDQRVFFNFKLFCYKKNFYRQSLKTLCALKWHLRLLHELFKDLVILTFFRVNVMNFMLELRGEHSVLMKNGISLFNIRQVSKFKTLKKQ